LTNDDRQRMMEFIIEQQAQFAASIQRHEENLQRLEKDGVRDRPRHAELEKSFLRLTELCAIYDIRLDDIECSTSTLQVKTSRLADAYRRLDRLVEKNKARLDRLESRS
jgi:hypothetical protein